MYPAKEMMNISTAAGVLAAAALLASTSTLLAQRPVKQTANVVGQGPAGPLVGENGATVTRTENGVGIALAMPTPPPGSYNYPPPNRFQPVAPVPGTPEVFTGWAFIFNQPENCAVPNQCVPPPPGAPTPNDFTTGRGGVHNFAGHPVSGGGTLNLVGHISVGDSQFGGPFGLENPAGAEIHVAVAPHGVLVPELVPDQFRTPVGSPPFWWLAQFPSAVEVPEATTPSLLYDNMELPRINSSIIGPPLQSKQQALAQQFVMGDSDNVASISLFLNRRGSPSGEVEVEIWENGASGVPSSLVASVGTIDLQDLSSSPTEVTFETLVTGLSPNARYHVVLNNDNTTISSSSNSYQSGVLGQSNDEQSEGTNGAARILSSTPTTFNGEWRSYEAFQATLGFADGCYNGSCPNYLRMRVTAAALLGDFDQDGSLDAVDIDQLSLQLRATPDNRSFDLNNDATLSQADREVWVHDLANTYFGDSNLDGEFNSGDLTEVFKANEYEDNITLNSTWGEGDWNGDGDFDSGDLVAAFKDGGYEQGKRVATVAVPEPSSASLLGVLYLSLLHAIRKRSD